MRLYVCDHNGIVTLRSMAFFTIDGNGYASFWSCWCVLVCVCVTSVCVRRDGRERVRLDMVLVRDILCSACV